MRRDEALVFKVYDSAEDGRARWGAHTSFIDPTTPQRPAAREHRNPSLRLLLARLGPPWFPARAFALRSTPWGRPSGTAILSISRCFWRRFAMSYVLPFELLLISYIVLGPAHYYTEISWLHDRKYFMPHRGLAVVLALAALGGMFIADPWWSGVLVWSCLIGAAIAALGPSPHA